MRLFQLVLVGSTGSGRTTLCSRLIGNKFSTNFEPIANFSYFPRWVSACKKNILFQIYDTSNEIVCHAPEIFYKAAIIALCIDLEKPNDSITYIKEHVAGKISDCAHFAVVFTKADSPNAKLALENAENLAQAALDLVGAKKMGTQSHYVITSSQEGTHDTFTKILEMWAKQLIPPTPRPQSFNFSGESPTEISTPPSNANPNPLSKIFNLMSRIKTGGKATNDTANNVDLPPPSGTQYRV